MKVGLQPSAAICILHGQDDGAGESQHCRAQLWTAQSVWAWELLLVQEQALICDERPHDDGDDDDG